MANQNKEKPAILIIDMVKYNFDESNNIPITPLARKITAPINKAIGVFRREGWPVVFPLILFMKKILSSQAG